MAVKAAAARTGTSDEACTGERALAINSWMAIMAMPEASEPLLLPQPLPMTKPSLLLWSRLPCDAPVSGSGAPEARAVLLVLQEEQAATVATTTTILTGPSTWKTARAAHRQA